MSIELETPETVLGKVDAALNFLAQCRIARMIGDNNHFEIAFGEVNRHLVNALEQLEEGDSSPSDPEVGSTPVLDDRTPPARQGTAKKGDL